MTYQRKEVISSFGGADAMTLPEVIRKARESLRLVQGCLECNADDERRWAETIAWLEGLA